MTKMILLPIMLLNLVEGGAQHVSLRLKAEENEVPKSVVMSFRDDFGTADASWAIVSSSWLGAAFGIYPKDEREKSTYYAVCFTASDGHREAVYDHFGHSVGVKKSVTTASLPAPVVRTVQRYCAPAEIISADEVSVLHSVSSHYVIVLHQEDGARTIMLRASGELIKKN